MAPVEDQVVLVTGGAGFIGSHLVDAVVGENEVRVLVDFSSGARTRLPNEVAVFEAEVFSRRSGVAKPVYTS